MNKGKKIVSIITVICMVLFLGGCKDKIVIEGTWVADEVEIEGTGPKYSEDEVQMMKEKYNMTDGEIEKSNQNFAETLRKNQYEESEKTKLQFNEDGTGTAEYLGQKMDITWVLDDRYVRVYWDNELLMELSIIENNQLYLTRTSQELKLVYYIKFTKE